MDYAENDCKRTVPLQSTVVSWLLIAFVTFDVHVVSVFSAISAYAS